MITVTPRVKQAVKLLARDRHWSHAMALRLGIAPDRRHPGATRLRYVLDLDAERPRPSDRIFGDQDLILLVAEEHLAYLDGLELDARVEGQRAHCLFRNPNAQQTCGCGRTFATE